MHNFLSEQSEKAREYFPRGLHQMEDVRFSVDALLLASFAPEAERAMDLGTGCGIIGLGMLLRNAAQHVTGLDCDPDQLDAANANAALLGVSQAFTTVCRDLSTRGENPDQLLPLVVSNPPWREAGAERAPTSLRRQRALYGARNTLELFTRAASLYLERGGRFCVLVGAARLSEMLSVLDAGSFSPARLLCVHPRKEREARFVLVEARSHVKARLRILAPLTLHPSGRGTAYTDEALRFCPWLERSSL